MPHMYILQLIEVLPLISNGHYSYICDIFNKYFARSARTIFTFRRLIFNFQKELERLPHGYQ